MRICGQTLILVDNDETVSEVNQKIVKATLKYMFYHAPEDRAFCLSTYSHSLDDEEEYTSTIEDLLCEVDNMEFSAKDSNLSDVLTDTLKKWKDSDFACRDIIVFTDGLEGVAQNYEREELFYVIENTSYPIYIVDLVQDNNDHVKKTLSAIATTSDGELFMSEFEGDDAEVDRQLTEGIYAAMDEYAKREWGIYENAQADDNNEKTEDGEAESDVNADEYGESSDSNSAGTYEREEMSRNEGVSDEDVGEYYSETDDYSSEVIYENNPYSTILDSPVMLACAGVLVVVGIIAAIVCGLCFMKRRAKGSEEEKKIREFTERNSVPKDFFADEHFDTDYKNTVLLSESDAVAAGGDTRILDIGESVCRIELENSSDCSDRRELYVDRPIIVGRQAGVADVVFADDSVSKRHCELGFCNGEYYIKDLGSSNGVFVNGVKTVKALLKDGDMVRIGKNNYYVRL